MNTFMNQLTQANNFTRTENSALAHKTTNSAVYDLFAFGSAYRSRTDTDVILLFKNAFEEDHTLAMKCLFYIRDIRGGTGERRFFRTAFRWLCNEYPQVAKKNLVNISEYGRWDDLVYATEGTKVEAAAFDIIKHQLALDVQCKTPSLLAKWLPSQNASNKETKRLGYKLAKYLDMTSKQYRKTLSALRERINVLERLMSSNQWDKIEFDKIPSKAGLIYKNAFARRDVLAKKYEAFAKNKDTKVNAAALYPYEIVKKAISNFSYWSDTHLSDVDRAMLEKYWDNQIDVLNGKPCKMICVCDTSGSMIGQPMNVAIGLSMYCAERIGGPFKNHYISFSSRPQLIKIEGVDFVDKVYRIYRTNLCENTNIKATFDMLKKAALNARPEDRPDTVCIISDMQIDSMSSDHWSSDRAATEMERIRTEWLEAGLECPRLIYWNVNARNNTILDAGPNVSFVSGASPAIFKQVVTGVSGYQLMLQTILAPRYEAVTA